MLQNSQIRAAAISAADKPIATSAGRATDIGWA
jgi:hypothetical protein